MDNWVVSFQIPLFSSTTEGFRMTITECSSC